LNIKKSAFFGIIGYHPHERQASIHSSGSRFRVVAAGARSGKSMAAGVEIAYELFKPNRHIWCVATQYELAEKEFDWAVQFLDRGKIKGVKLLDLCRCTMSRKGSKSLETPWGSWARTKSAEKPTSLLGDELDFLVLCEASQIPTVVWERYLRPRIGPRNGKVLACSTPNADAGLFFDLYNKAESEPDWERWNFSTLANPTFSKAEWGIAKKELDEKVFAEQYEGLFVSRRGKVFDLDNRSIIENLKGIEYLPRAVCVHFKANNPIAILFVALKFQTKEIFVYDEIREMKTLPELVPVIKRRLAGSVLWGVFVDYWDKAIQSEAKGLCAAVVTNHREKEIGKQQAYIRRIQSVQNHLKICESGQSKMRVFRKCSALIEDFDRAKWPDKKNEIEEKQEADSPLTKFIFGPLAISYLTGFMSSVSPESPYAEQGKNPTDEEEFRWQL